MEIYESGERHPHAYRPDKGPSPEERVFFRRSALNDWTPLWEKIAFFCLGFFGLQIIALLTSGIILLSGLAESEPVRATSLNQFLAYLLLVLAFGVFIVFDKRKTWKRFLADFKDWKAYLYALAGLAGIYVVNLLFGLMYSGIAFYGDNENQSAIVSCVSNDPVLMFFATVLFAPFVEEITYRIGLVDSIGHKRRWLGVLLSSVIFGAIHFDWASLLQYLALGEESGITRVAVLNELLNLPVYICSGLVLGFTYAIPGRISSSMVGHALNNAISFFAILAL